MKHALHRFLGLIRSLMLFAAGAAMLLIPFAGARCQGQDCWLWILDSLRPHGAFVLVAGALVLCVELCYLWTRPTKSKTPEELSFKAKGGDVSVKVSTVIDAISRLFDEFDDIEELKPTVLQDGRHVDVDLDVKVRTSARVPELCEQLKSRAREVITEQVGLFKLREVRVRIGELVDVSPAQATDTAEDAAVKENENA